MQLHRKATLLAAAIGAALVLPDAARADRCGPIRSRSRSPSGGSADFESYAILKGGGMDLDGADPGGWFGLELGGSAASRLDVGFSVDWYHRRSREMDLLFETEHGFEPPIRGEITRFESSADFVPLGVTLRLRVPIGRGSVVPFVSGTLGYEILHLEFLDRAAPPLPYDDLLGGSETLAGFGWQAAAGVEIALAPGIGLLGEAGLHRGTPSRTTELDGVPVDLSAPLDGAFLRVGLRVGL